MTLAYDLYWSFRSPYSCLVTPRLVALERDHEVSANVRVVYPIAVRQLDFFANNDPLRLSYFMRDIGRSADLVGLPFRWASPDPVEMDCATRPYPKEQPYIHRLTHLGVAATERGRAAPLLYPLVMLAIALTGRFISLAADGISSTAFPPMAVEAGMIIVLLIGRRVLSRQR